MALGGDASGASAAAAAAAGGRFNGAKSISSDMMFDSGEDAATRMERQEKLKQFGNSDAISSSDFFGDKEDEHVTAGDVTTDLINKLRFQAREDISTLKNVAKNVTAKATQSFLNWLNN